MGLSYRDKSNDMQHDMFRSGHDLDQRSNFQLHLSRPFYVSFDATWREQHHGDWIISSSYIISEVMIKKSTEIKIGNFYSLFFFYFWRSPGGHSIQVGMYIRVTGFAKSFEKFSSPGLFWCIFGCWSRIWFQKCKFRRKKWPRDLFEHLRFFAIFT